MAQFLFGNCAFLYICVTESNPYNHRNTTAMKRSEFLRLFGGILLATQIPDSLLARVMQSDKPTLELTDVRRITIKVGATAPFKALHISDSHLTRVDERDNERKKQLAAKRLEYFPQAEQYLDAAIRYAHKNNLMLLHTGDLTDFVSEANLDYVESVLAGTGWYVAAGNHEFSQYVGEAKEDAAYKAQSFDRVQRSFPNNLTVASRVVNGVNFVAIDNVYYYVTAEQHAAVQREFDKGLPVVLMCHIPFYTPKHCLHTLINFKGRSSYMVATPESVMNEYRSNPDNPVSDRFRNVKVEPMDKATQEFCDWLKQQKLLKAIICGHMHEFYQENFTPSVIQYTVGGGYDGCAYEIEFV